MALKGKKSSTLNRFFLKYLVGFSVAVIFLVVMVIIAFSLAIYAGVVLPANDTEQRIARVAETLAEASEFDKSLIPHTANYVYMSKEGHVLDSNMSESRIAKLQVDLSSEMEKANRQYHQILRKDGSLLVLQYDIAAHFANPELHRIFPKPEIAILLLLILGTGIIAWVVTYQFSKRLKREIAPLVEATEHIQRQELDFDIHSSSIREIDDVLESLEGLKEDLSRSLKEQWTLERNKRKQMNALIHDIKTPLTIIKGNSDLLAEGELSAADRELLTYIRTSSNKIEDFIEFFMEARRSQDGNQANHSTFAVKDLIAEIESQARALCSIKQLNFNVVSPKDPGFFQGDQRMIVRALCNIISNAVDYSSDKGEIILTVEGKSPDGLSFTVTDFGTGFSQEDLQYATTEFYTKQKERSGKHYGLGLFIAKQVAEKHGGKILIHNNEDSKGASVTMEITSS